MVDHAARQGMVLEGKAVLALADNTNAVCLSLTHSRPTRHTHTTQVSGKHTSKKGS
jgi:hypothetical protein